MKPESRQNGIQGPPAPRTGTKKDPLRSKGSLVACSPKAPTCAFLAPRPGDPRPKRPSVHTADNRRYRSCAGSSSEVAASHSTFRVLKTKVSGVDGNRTVEATKGRLVLSLIDGDDYASVLQRVVTAAHHHLRLDAVYISELTPGIETYRAVAGDAAAFGVHVGDTATRETALCELVVTGQLPALVRDTRADGGIAGLPVATVAGVRAYIGVPLVYSDGTVHGMICGLGRSPDASLDDRDVRFMAMLAELLVDRLDERRESDRLRSSINELIANGQLDIAAQPIVDLRDGHCLGVEALSRFRPPFGAPDATFAAATAVGLGLDLERLAVQRAWDLLPYLRADQFVTVNLSPSSALTLARRAQMRSDLPLSQVVVEITEHSAIESYTDLRNELKPLRQAGLRVAVDDAGAGYAIAARRGIESRLYQDRPRPHPRRG